MTRIDPGSRMDPDTPGSQRDGGTAAGGNGKTEAPLPRPHIKKMRWPFPIVWIVPLAAAIGAGFYFHRILQERGPLLNITFDDAGGLKVGETPVTVHGVRIGTVESVSLSPDEGHAIVHVRLYRGTEQIAKKDTIFWMVKPDISGGNLIGVGAIATGPYIEAIPGHGEPTTDFAGVTKEPAMVGPGMRVVLHAQRIGKLQIDSPVYYRGIQVGVIQDIRLSDDSTEVNATAYIWMQFSRLLYTHSQFWVENDTGIKGSIFTGLQLQVGSLRSLLGGGVEFATPETDRGELAEDGTQFYLHDEEKKEWGAWAPRIALGPNALTNGGAGNGAQQQNQEGLQSAVKQK